MDTQNTQNTTVDIALFGIRQSSRDFWDEQFATFDTKVEDTYDTRVQCGYRITREMAVLKGIVAPYQTLAEGTAMHPCPFSSPTGIFQTPDTEDFPKSSQHQYALSLLTRSNDGTALVPSEHMKPEETSAFSRAARTIAGYLGLFLGTKQDRHVNKAALRYLLSTNYSSAAWPSKEEILRYEEDLVAKITDSIVSRGDYPTYVFLRDDYGLSRQEIKNIITVSTKSATDMLSQVTLEDHRAQLVNRLDDFASRARMAGQLNAELGAYKQLAIVTGIANAAPVSENDDFIRMVKNATQTAALVKPESELSIEEPEE